MTLVERIRHDLLQLLAQGEQPDLRLKALAERYGASTRPVRLALEQLCRSGVLAQDAGGHWRIARVPRRAPVAVAADDLGKRLEDLLVKRALSGDGSYLREAETAVILNSGRGALRRLLAECAGKGLVEHHPRCGWKVRTLTQAHFESFLQVREILELLALDLAFPHLEDAVLADFAAANSNGNIDNRLHGYLIARAGNPYIADFFTRHGPFFEMIFNWEGQDREAEAQASGHHRQIIGALRAGDRAGARSALSAHIRSNHPLLQRLMAADP